MNIIFKILKAGGFMKKKILLGIALASLVGASSFAADADLVVRYGIFGQGNAIINGHSEDAAADLGAGLSFEFGMPFYIFGKQNGLKMLVSYDPLLGVKSPVTKGSDVDVLFGYWLRFPIGLTDFAFQPELDYGLIYKYVTTDSTTSRMDQKFLLGLSMRWNPLDFAKGKLEFEFTPQFGIETFNSPNSIYLGARLGAHFIFGKNAGTDDRIAAREGKIVDATAKEIASDPDLKDAVSVYRSAEGITVCLDSINFKPDSYELEETEYVKLDKVVKMLKKYDNTLHIVGHCAKTAGSTDEEDKEFSLQRAKTVASYFEQKGVRKSSTKIRISGKGSSEPRGDNETEEGRKLNRRVEVTLVRKL